MHTVCNSTTRERVDRRSLGWMALSFRQKRTPPLLLPAADKASKNPRVSSVGYASLQALGLLAVATVLEVSGDAIVRVALRNHEGLTAIRLALFVLGVALVFGYATLLNLAPLEFREVVGLYIATLFIVWQIVNFVFFRTTLTAPVLMGGALIVVGGSIVSFWKA